MFSFSRSQFVLTLPSTENLAETERDRALRLYRDRVYVKQDYIF